MIYLINTDTCFGIACSIDNKKSYHKIYKIKNRGYEKPLAIMVDSFNWLEKNTDLNKEQINFLRIYNKPFTVLCNSTPIKHWLNYEDEAGDFINKNLYKKIAFRVANTPEQEKLIKEVGPIFLTSANLSGDKEIYEEKDLLNQFSYYLDKNIVKYIDSKNKKSMKNLPPSDIFEFIGDVLEVRYLRKS